MKMINIVDRIPLDKYINSSVWLMPTNSKTSTDMSEENPTDSFQFNFIPFVFEPSNWDKYKLNDDSDSARIYSQLSISSAHLCVSNGKLMKFMGHAAVTLNLIELITNFLNWIPFESERALPDASLNVAVVINANELIFTR